MKILTKPPKSGHLRIAGNFDQTRRCPLFKGLTVYRFVAHVNIKVKHVLTSKLLEYISLTIKDQRSPKKLIFKTFIRPLYLFMFVTAQIFCFGWSINPVLAATFDFAALRNSSVTSETNLSSSDDSLFLNKNAGLNHQNLLLTIEFGGHPLVVSICRVVRRRNIMPVVRFYKFINDINAVLDPNIPFFVIFYPI